MVLDDLAVALLVMAMIDVVENSRNTLRKDVGECSD
jgi:hypothetical protein